MKRSEFRSALGCLGAAFLASVPTSAMPSHAHDSEPFEAVRNLSLGHEWKVIEGGGSLESLPHDVLRWKAEPPLARGVIETLLPEVDFSAYDEVRLDYKMEDGPVMLTLATNGYPDRELTRHWYDKQPPVLDEWRHFAVNLGLDDDGIPTDPKSAQALRIGFHILMDPDNPAPKPRQVSLKNIRLVRHPVALTYKNWDMREGWEGDFYWVTFPLNLQNRLDRPVRVSLQTKETASQEKSPPFEAVGDRTWTLSGGEKKTVEVRYRISREEIRRVGSFRVRVLEPSLNVRGFEEPLDFLQSSRREVWTLATPPLADSTRAAELTPARLERVRLRAAGAGPWREILERFVADAERRLHEPIVLPPARAGYDQDRKTERGEWARLHGKNARKALDFARAYALTGREDFRAAAADLLRAYARSYLTWDYLRPGTTAFRMRTTDTTLNSGFLLPPFGLAYDGIRDSLSGEDRKLIEEGFLNPASADLDNHVTQYTNQMSVHQLLPFYTAVATKRWSLAAQYVEGPRGLKAFRENAFGLDGFTLENDLGYQWNALDWVIPVYRTALDLGWDAGKMEFSTPFVAPLLGADDPAEFNRRYEWIYARYRDPLLAVPLRKGKRDSLEALFFGVDELPPAEKSGDMIAHLEHAGHVHARRITPAGLVQASLNYGSPWGRMERDFFSLKASLDGRPLVAEAGRFQYGMDDSDFMYHTAAHNAVLPRGADQRAHGRGILKRKEQTDHCQILQVASDRNAPVLDAPADFVRTVVVTDEALLLLDVYRSEAPFTVAWTLHPGTGIQVPAEWDRASPPVDSPGWRYGIVKDWRKNPLPGTGWRIGLTSGSPAQEVFLQASVPCDLFAFAYPTGHRMTGSRTSLALVSERETSAAVWGAVIPFGPGASTCEAVELVHGEPGAPVTLKATINGKPLQVSVSPARDFHVDVGP